jgi:type VI secretion system protein ImpI
MQHALKLLLAELDPEVIDKTLKADHGLARIIASRKTRLWDIYMARWQLRTKGNEDGILNAFMNYFAQYYDRNGNDPL